MIIGPTASAARSIISFAGHRTPPDLSSAVVYDVKPGEVGTHFALTFRLRRISDNHVGAALPGQVSNREIRHGSDPISAAHQEVNVQEYPRDPGNESAQLNARR